MRGADGRSGARGRCRGSTPAYGRRGRCRRRAPLGDGHGSVPVCAARRPRRRLTGRRRRVVRAWAGADAVSALRRRGFVPACAGRSQQSAGPHPRRPVRAPPVRRVQNPEAAAPRRRRGPNPARAECGPPGTRRPPPRRDHPRRGRMRPSRPAVQRFRCGWEARGPAEPRHVRPQDGSAGTVSSPDRASPPQPAGPCGTGAPASARSSTAGRGRAPRSGPGRRGTAGGRAGGHVWPRVSGSTVSGSSPRRLATSSTTVS